MHNSQLPPFKAPSAMAQKNLKHLQRNSSHVSQNSTDATKIVGRVSQPTGRPRQNSLLGVQSKNNTVIGSTDNSTCSSPKELKLALEQSVEEIKPVIA